MKTVPRTVVKLSTPSDIVGLLPYRVGFQPTESVVVMCLNGPRKRAGLVVRHDLVPAEQERELAEFLAWHVRRNRAVAVIVAVYTDAPDDGEDLPRRAVVDGLRRAAAVPVAEALLVRGGRWWSYACSRSCCPREGTPVPDRPAGAAGRFAAESAVEGRAVLPDRAALERSVWPHGGLLADAARAQALDAAAEALVRTHDADGLDAVRHHTAALLGAATRRWAEGSRDLDPETAARILVGLRDTWSRDHAATLALDVDVEHYLPLLVELCRHADAADAAPICTVLAWVAYQQGEGALANVAIDRALRCDPDYEMAHLLLQGLDAQMPPDTVRALTRRTREDLDAMARGEQPRDRDVPAPRRGARPRRRGRR